jgi:hypothetical protein
LPTGSKFSFRSHRLRDSPEILKTVNAGVMAIAPHRLQSIAADNLKSDKPKAVVGIIDIRPKDVPKNIRLATARSAWTGATKELQIEIRLRAVIPTNGQFITDLLDVCRFQRHWGFNPTTMPILRAILALGSSGVEAGVSPAPAGGKMRPTRPPLHLPRSFAENRGSDPD